MEIGAFLSCADDEGDGGCETNEALGHDVWAMGSDFWDCHGCANAECRTANGEGKGEGLSWVGLEVRVTGSWDTEVSGRCMAHVVRLYGTCWTAVI